ncbi:MAG: ABC transporter ATP-binding protein [Gammaproteobacteria bacterium]|nr:ABC transporter ATP-binding protein [Gammaproteobacteria bacterium]
MNALSIIELSKEYNNGVKALQSINFNVKQGEFFALLGPNGAGKTTAIGIITSLVNKTSGQVKVFDFDIDKRLNQAKACIGVVPQEINLNLFDRTFNILVNQAGFYGIPRKESIERSEHFLKKMELWDKRNEMARNLSGGMKRRLMVARALVNKPKLLLLDEPTAGVDIETRRMMYDFLQEINRNGTTIILTTHYLEEAERLCDQVAIIDQGKITENDSMSNVLSKLKIEIFILNIKNPLEKPPIINGYEAKLNKPKEIEINVKQGQSLNDVFIQLKELGIEVLSMRNKTNRLEELFIEMTKNNQNGNTNE